MKNKTGQFVRAISKAVKTGRPEYTLGQMNMKFSIMKEVDTVKASPLLQDIQSYLEENTLAHNLLDYRYINSVNDIVKNIQTLLHIQNLCLLRKLTNLEKLCLIELII